MGKLVKIDSILTAAVMNNASSILLSVGAKPKLKINGTFKTVNLEPLTKDDMKSLLMQICSDDHLASLNLPVVDSVDFAYQTNDSNAYRFRMNVFKSGGIGNFNIVGRRQNTTIPKLENLGLNKLNQIIPMLKRRSGLIILTGIVDSGKTTTLTGMLDWINNNSSGHIITLEDPIEYLLKHGMCVVNQREMVTDFVSFGEGVISSLREDFSVLAIGEMRDAETIEAALRAAETGHLVISTLHTGSCKDVPGRICDMVDASKCKFIRKQLSSILTCCIHQRLIPTVDNKRVMSSEIMISNPAIKSLIREDKDYQLDSVIRSDESMISLEQSLAYLVQSGEITKGVAEQFCNDSEFLSSLLGGV